MEPTIELQQVFFNTLKNTLPPHISMVDEIAEILNISYDSVYRRIRGEKPISISELKLLCDHYHISFDQVLQLQNDNVVFQAPGINLDGITFLDYLKGMLQQVKYFNSFKQKQMLYFCKDMIFFQFYLFPEIAAFKTFFWIKTIQNNPEYNHSLFSLAEFPFHDCLSIGQQILEEYNQIPSVELWNFESVNSTISQIQYYRDSGIFASTEDFEIIISSLEKTLDHLQLQAERGTKFMPGQENIPVHARLQFYVNEVVIGNNTIMLELDGTRLSTITYSVFGYLMTKDARFNQNVFNSFKTVLSRSTLISGTGERERNKFFRSLRERVQQLRK
jgi:BetR domain